MRHQLRIWSILTPAKRPKWTMNSPLRSNNRWPAMTIKCQILRLKRISHLRPWELKCRRGSMIYLETLSERGRTLPEVRNNSKKGCRQRLMIWRNSFRRELDNLSQQASLFSKETKRLPNWSKSWKDTSSTFLSWRPKSRNWNILLKIQSYLVMNRRRNWNKKFKDFLKRLKT